MTLWCVCWWQPDNSATGILKVRRGTCAWMLYARSSVHLGPLLRIRICEGVLRPCGPAHKSRPVLCTHRSSAGHASFGPAQ